MKKKKLNKLPSLALPSIGQEHRPPLTPARPKCNSILHLFGEWLFEAAHIGGDAWLQHTKSKIFILQNPATINQTNLTHSEIATEASRRPSSMIMDNRKGSLSLSQPSSLTEPTGDGMPAGLTIDKYESGRAEAVGALCRIFCAKKTGEEILPVYLARFYMAVQQGLKIPAAASAVEHKECEETMASILYNSADLFRLDLDGVQVLLPSFISALELLLPEKEMKWRQPHHAQSAFNKTDLRRAAIHLLLSMLSLPLHFQTLPIRDLSNTSLDKCVAAFLKYIIYFYCKMFSTFRMTTFAQLKPRLINILMNALQVETDAQNTHMLLGGLLLCVQDSALFEDGGDQNNAAAEPTYHSSASPAPSNNDGNLLSSGICAHNLIAQFIPIATNTILHIFVVLCLLNLFVFIYLNLIHHNASIFYTHFSVQIIFF